MHNFNIYTFLSVKFFPLSSHPLNISLCFSVVLLSLFSNGISAWNLGQKSAKTLYFIRLLNVILIITQQSILLTIPVAFISKSPYPFLWFCCTVIVCRIRENMHNLIFFDFLYQVWINKKYPPISSNKISPTFLLSYR